MFAHHQQSVEQVTSFFARDPEILAVLLGGSIAHGFADADSDIDVLLLVSDADYAERARTGRLHFFSRELCTYPAGYVDGKYLSPTFLQAVQERGSEPARFAFQDAQILSSRIPTLAQALQAIARYPAEHKTVRIRRFYAQLEAWHWYADEARKRHNRYLLGVAVSKLVLFGGRLLLAHNELLYPYHKWFLRVLERAPDKPPGVLELIEQLTRDPDPGNIAEFYELIVRFRSWELPVSGWPSQFMHDSEWNWLDGRPPVDDL